ncbi:MAG: hypothetical protein AB1742_11115, partial [bacterium]
RTPRRFAHIDFRMIGFASDINKIHLSLKLPPWSGNQKVRKFTTLLRTIFLLLLLEQTVCIACCSAWQLGPEHWKAPRIVHGPFDENYASRIVRKLAIQNSVEQKFARKLSLSMSPNGDYWFSVRNEREEKSGVCTSLVYVYRGLVHLDEIQLKDHACDVAPVAGWLGEKIVTIRVWWNQDTGSDLIYDVEEDKFIYQDMIRDGTREFLETHPELKGLKEFMVDLRRPEAQSIADFKEALTTLPVGDWESIPKAVKAYRDIFLKDKTNAQAGLRMFRDFYHRVLYESDLEPYRDAKLNNVLHEMATFAPNRWVNPIPYFRKAKDTKAEEIRKKYSNELNVLYAYQDSGFGFHMGEGDWYTEEDFSFLSEKVLNGFDFELKEFIIFMIHENQQRVLHDAALVIGWDDLRKRIIRWEDFAKKHPHLLETFTEVEGYYTNRILKRQVRLYLTGEANTPAYENEKIVPELQKSYERFLVENRDSRFYPTIRAVYQILKKNGFHRSVELDEYFKQFY